MQWKRENRVKMGWKEVREEKREGRRTRLVRQRVEDKARGEEEERGGRRKTVFD